MLNLDYFFHVGVGLVAYQEFQIAQVVGDNAMMPSAARNLAFCEGFLKFVTIAPEFMWPDEGECFRFRPAKDSCVTSNFNFNSERLGSISREIRIDERQKFAHVVAIGNQVDFAYVIRRPFNIQRAKKWLERTLRMSKRVLGNVD